MKGQSPGRTSLFTAYRQFARSVYDDRYHLIIYPHINKTQLFDLQTDPHEIKDLVNDPAQAKTIDRLTASLKDWQNKLADTQPLRSEKPQPLEFDFSKVPAEKKKKEKKVSSGVPFAMEQRCVLNVYATDPKMLVIAGLDVSPCRPWCWQNAGNPTRVHP
jgi:hypothetical protein